MTEKLTLKDALVLLEAALGASRESGFRPMGVVVLDAAANVLLSAREDGATPLRLDIAQGKAAAAVGMGVNSRQLAKRAADMPTFFAAIGVSSAQKFVPQTGAVLIRDSEGKVLGAVGASGGTGDEDEQIVIAGVKAAGLYHA